MGNNHRRIVRESWVVNTVRATVHGSQTGGQTVVHESTGIQKTRAVLAVLEDLVLGAVVTAGVDVGMTPLGTLTQGTSHRFLSVDLLCARSELFWMYIVRGSTDYDVLWTQ